MADNLLDIVTKVDRPTITIDDKPHEIKHPNELSMADFHVLSKYGASLINFGKQYEADPDAAFEKIKDCMAGILEMIMPDLPKDVRDILNSFMVQQILEVFISLSRIKRDQGEPPSPKKSSLDSVDSMAQATT